MNTQVTELQTHILYNVKIVHMAGSFCVFVYDARINGFLSIVT
jgi:hypothetical protein